MHTRLDLSRLPSGSTYENTYGQYMKLFRLVAEATEAVVINPPDEWAPFLYYLGATLQWEDAEVDYSALGLPHFPTIWSSGRECLKALRHAEKLGRLRELVETFEGNRPELVDALYKSDMEWETVGRRHQTQKEFVITTNGSFQRPEVLEYIRTLHGYNSSAPAALLLPCAADKPYPSPLHTKALEVVREACPSLEWEVVVFTGTLGFCPAPLWEQMPHYDSGMPNQWRLMQMTRNFIPLQRWQFVLVYGDFYNTAVQSGLALEGYTGEYDGRNPCEKGPIMSSGVDLPQHVYFVNPCIDYTEYLDLLSEANLVRLRTDAEHIHQYARHSQANMFK